MKIVCYRVSDIVGNEEIRYVRTAMISGGRMIVLTSNQRDAAYEFEDHTAETIRYHIQQYADDRLQDIRCVEVMKYNV